MEAGAGMEAGAPYRRVVSHGFVVDSRGRKMSKSVGNVVDPMVGWGRCTILAPGLESTTTPVF